MLGKRDAVREAFPTHPRLLPIAVQREDAPTPTPRAKALLPMIAKGFQIRR